MLEGCELWARELWARELGQIGLQPAKLEDPALIRLVGDIVARIDRDVQPIGNERVLAPVEVGDSDLPRAVRLLLRIHAALVHLASA